MAETISWNYSVSALGGPVATRGGQLASDGYEKLSVMIAAGVTQTVTLGAGTWKDVQILALSANDLSGAITVKPDGGTAIPLDGPVVLVGAGPVALLGTGAAKVVFKNTGTTDALIDIFVARDATP